MEENNRRPLKVRSLKSMNKIAAWLAIKNITPNAISVFSIVCALLAGASLVAMPKFPEWKIISLMLVIVGVQGRLLCNLFDGMVAVEGGKKTASGELFNDIPDRISDPIIIVAIGYAISHIPHAIELSWFAGLLSIMTAYVRTLSTSMGVPVNFCGPMAKQHRMALITAASFASIFESFWGWNGQIFYYALIVLIIGCFITIFRRANMAYQFLENKKK